MTETACRWAGSDRGRVLVGRHGDHCPGESCEGCEECTRAHCRVCYRDHSATVCGGCMTAIRDDLADIRRMHAALPTEAIHRGVNGEAMSLLGPVADPEAWGHHEASAKVGRTAEQWTDGNDYLHPLWVTATWADVYREAFDDPEPATPEVETECAYLNRKLTDIAGYPHVPVEDMARDLRKCRGHLEDVLRDGDRPDTGAPCVQCATRLERHVTDDGREWWWCGRCKTNLTDDQYRYAVGVAYRANADRLPAGDLADRLGVPLPTIRQWTARARVYRDGEVLLDPPRLPSCGRDTQGRPVYSVAAAEVLRGEQQCA